VDTVEEIRVSNAHPDARVQRVTRGPACIHLNEPIEQRSLRTV
jgi:hypothetical protein